MFLVFGVIIVGNCIFIVFVVICIGFLKDLVYLYFFFFGRGVFKVLFYIEGLWVINCY